MTRSIVRSAVSCATGLLLLAASAWTARSARAPEPTRALPNDNRTPAGKLGNGVLTLHLEVREARWFPDGDAGPSGLVRVFAEEGSAPRNPGPLIRVRSGTRVRVRVRNPLRDSTLVVHGLHGHARGDRDTIQVSPGGVREVAFTARTPGTYFYWATTSHAELGARLPMDTQLHGAFVVDPPGTVATDRIFVLGTWTVPPDTAGPPPHVPRDLRVINGLSWPHTERFAYTAGDTVRWRWINPTSSGHPMHLHGFYFTVTSRGTWQADTVYDARRERLAVTELSPTGGTFAMRWVPDEPGNWLMHCHIAFHASQFLSFAPVPDPDDPLAPEDDHSVHGMRGMILGITVTPGRSTARRPAQTTAARALRLVAQSAPGAYAGKLEGLAYVLHDGTTPPRDSLPIPSSTIILRRGEPVRITVVNRLRTPTAVHWHGLEIPSYSDGVPGWSGANDRVAPMIAPGDSFSVAFTPPRAGTFIYHSHANEMFQINLGLYGALLVVDSSRYDPTHERTFILGGNGVEGKPPARVNGKTLPDTVRLTAGETYRFRMIHMQPDVSAHFTLRDAGRTLEWLRVAKDGADIPLAQRRRESATLRAGPGETADFEYTPRAAGALTLDVRDVGGGWTIGVPIVVTAPAQF